MKKKTNKPYPTTNVTFSEGKERVRTMMIEMYTDIISDYKLTLANTAPVEFDDILTQTSLLSSCVAELVEMQEKLDECYDIFSIVNLSTQFGIFEGCEEMLIGAFLGQTIVIR